MNNPLNAFSAENTIWNEQHAFAIQAEYGVIDPDARHISFTYAQYPHSAVTLQPNGSFRHQVLRGKHRSLYSAPSMMTCAAGQDLQDDGMELNEASEPEARGIVVLRFAAANHVLTCVS